MKHKTVFLLLLFSFLIKPLWAENFQPEDYYFYQDREISVHLIPDQLSVVFAKETPQARFTNILQNVLGNAFKSADVKTGKRSRLLRLAAPSSKDELALFIQRLTEQPEILSAAPVYFCANPAKRLTVSQEFILRFDEQVPESEIEDFALQNNLAGKKKIAESTWLFTVDPSSGLNGLSAANKFRESESIVWAQPNFIYLNGGIFNASVNDTYWPQQWAHKNTGQSVATGAPSEFPATVNGFEDADMDVDLAWEELAANGGQAGGSSDILISTLDSGVDIDHPDLQGNLYSNGVDFTDDGQADANDSQGHGTAVAGLIAAVADNGRGVAGIAYNSKILPLRIMNAWGVTETANLVQAFDYAWQNGADVISNSWTSTTPEQALTEAIQRAKTEGRNGLGCVILFSSGNKGAEPVEYPADLDEVIAVGASNMFDEKKNNGSGDYNYKWSSNYGSALDVVAPTISYTTDIQGSAGYADGDYFDHFGGTSAACPNAAGVAALILAANSGLTSDQVQEALENSADKIERYSYDASGWNKHVGHGRVNAYNAVRQAFGNDGSAPLVVHQWPASNRSIDPRTISVDISDDNGIATGADQPSLFYRTIFETDTSDWASVTDSDGPAGSTYEFTIPGQKWATQVQYYILARDNSPQGNSQTYPFGGSAAQAPEMKFNYHVGNFETITYTSSDVPLSWENDWQTYHTSTLNITDTRRIVDLNVNIDYSGNVGEVGIDLKGPDNLGAGLFMHYEGSALSGTKFDDEASTTIAQGSSPYSGSFRADNGLFVFDGKRADGQWTLGAYDGDYVNSNDGSITNWSVEITQTLPNAAPVVDDIPPQTIDEGGSFSDIILDNYVQDADHPDDSLKWTYSGNQDLIISIDANRVAHIATPNQDWFGSELVTFTATDPGGYADSDTVLFTVNPVNDAPVVTDIEDQQINEGGSFGDIDLDDYVSDVDNTDAEMTWTSSGNVELLVSINAETHVAHIATPNQDWNGSETITFTATDPGGLSDSDPAVFAVKAINDAPVVDDIPDQTIDQGGSFTDIDLDDYVSDVDNTDAEMTWTSSGNTDLQVSIDEQTHVAQISVPNPDWTGSETIWFKATDPGGLADSNAAVFTVNAVNDTPVVSDIPDQTIDEGGSFTDIALDDYVTDENNSDDEMTWTFHGNQELLVSINSETRVAHIAAPDENWNGSETIWFKATDPGGLADSNAAVFTVNAVNDMPVVSDIPDQTIDEGGSFTDIALDDYVSDVDNTDAEITWTSSGNVELSVTINSETQVAHIATPNQDWNGSETITFTATDPGGLSDSDAAVFTVSAVNDTPVVSDIPDQSIDEGGSFTDIDLDDYVSDVDNTDAEMTWSSSGNVELSVTINAETHVAHIATPNQDWNGSETITFTATDPGGLSDSDAAVFTVSAVNDTPAVSDIPGQIIDEGAGFTDIDLDDYVSDADNTDAEMTWSSSGNVELSVTINSETHVAHIAPPNQDWNGSETITFTATDPGGLSDSDPAVFTVTAVNDTPRITSTPVTNATQGALYQYQVTAEDADADDVLRYALLQAPAFLSIDSASGLISGTPQNSDVGQHTVTVQVKDLAAASDEQTYQLTVDNENDPPVVDDIPDQAIDEGGAFADISLDNYVEDIDNADSEMTWTFHGNQELLVSINSETRVAHISAPDENWSGAETIWFKATDLGGLADSNAAVFTVNAVNDTPVVSAIPDQSIDEGGSFTDIALDDYVSDVDNTDAEMTWSSSGNVELSVSINAETHVAHIAPPNQDWNGSETITFTATDPGGLSDSNPALFTVTAVNDTPRITSTPVTNATQGALYQYQVTAEDVDADDVLRYALLQAPAFLSIDSLSGLISGTPQNSDVGQHTVTVQVKDLAAASDEQTYQLTVDNENDPPVVSAIPDQTTDEGQLFDQIILDNYVQDPDNSARDMQWSASGNDQLQVTINSERIATVTAPNSNWYGSEEIIFTATDPGGLSDSDTALFAITPVNDPPLISAIPDQEISEGSSFSEIHLDDFVQDVDDPDNTLLWTAAGNTHLAVTIDENRVARISVTDAEWNGSEYIVFTVQDPQGLSDKDTTLFTVLAVNDPPRFSPPLPDITFYEDDSLLYAISNWYPYVSDPDNADSTLHFSLSDGNDELSFTEKGTAFLFEAGPDWFGQDSLTLIADDGAAADSARLLVMVKPLNDAPQISDLPDSVVFKNTEAVKLQMSAYEQDIDSPSASLLWIFSASDSALNMEYEAASKELTLSAPGFTGWIDLYLTLQDDSGAVAQDTLPLIVKKQETAIRDLSGRFPLKHVLFQNYPNPFNPVTTIQFGLSRAAQVEIKIFDNLGREVSTLLNGRRAAGYHRLIFDAARLSSGVYFYRIIVKGGKPFVQIRKMLIVK